MISRQKICALLLGIMCFSATAFAQETTREEPTEGFTIFPTQRNAVDVSNIVHEAKPGQIIEDSVTIKNFYNTEKNFELYSADASISADGKTEFTVKEDTPKEVGTWITFEETATTLQPQEEKNIKFTIHIPEDTALGNYEGGIALENIAVNAKYPGIKFARRIMQRVKINVTNDPQSIPKLMEANIFNTTTPYFWASIGIFTGSVAYYIYSVRKEKKL